MYKNGKEKRRVRKQMIAAVKNYDAIPEGSKIAIIVSGVHKSWIDKKEHFTVEFRRNESEDGYLGRKHLDHNTMTFFDD
ncbi:hypothetical protein Clacol_009614 [Clathrus columnatus]|uniref:Uncharacterized protein n=1 Tax=Clathrus columnatus TaxID=1419009 RepID=A0AAV5AQM7_9AGAM|nr:hypothetical protein Clacol_009614 [Clathrus columnatus]